MKNKVISFSLVCALFMGQTNLSALDFDSTSTVGGSWTDSTSGMTYHSFGKKRYSFNKRTTQFTPWFKGRPPSIKSGCGGVSLDGGFAAFLNLEEIGKQLETAISSVGMGVIVVLVQTLPSIGKAFEDVQNFIRKIQSMLQNACQLTVSALSKNDTLAGAKKSMQDSVDNALGNNALSKSLKGATQWLDDAMNAANCSDNDMNCLRKFNSNFLVTYFGGVSDETGKTNMNINKCFILDSKACKKLDASVDSSTTPEAKISTDSLENFLNNKFKDKALGLTAADITMIKLKYGIFGVLAVDAKDSVTQYSDSNGNLLKTSALVLLAENNTQTPANLALQWVKPKTSIPDVLEFLTGGVDINGTETKKLEIPSDIKVVQAKACAKASENGDKCESAFSSIQYLELADVGAESTSLPVSWEGLYKNTYKTIMHEVNPTLHAAPSVSVGVFVPRGDEYLKMIKEYSGGQNSSYDTQYYADILARTNIIYAIKYLILEIKQDAMDLGSANSSAENKAVIDLYLQNVNSVVADLEKQMVDYPGDVVYLDHLSNVFDDLERKNKINRASTRK